MSSIAPFERPEALDRWMDRERFANFKVVCECGATEFISRASMTECVDEFQYWHWRHQKTIYYKEASQLEFRGNIPAMIAPAEVHKVT